MRAEKRKRFQDLVEEEEEEVGLAFPPFDEEDFMAAEASYFDLSEELFFSSVHDDRKSAERLFEGSSGNLSAVQIKQKRHGKGKDMKVLEEVYRHKDINACKDTNTETKAKIIESKKTSTKAAIGDGVSQEEEKINLAKRKFHERYEQIAKEKKRKQIQVLSISELPKVPREKCRPVKYRSGFTPKFKSFAEEEEEEDVGLACPPFHEEDFMAAKASYSDLSEEVFFSRIDNDQKIQIKQKRHGNGKDMKVLEEVCWHEDINACKDTKIETKAKIIESMKTLTKAAIGDGVSQEEKINLAKRKFHER
ncbi:hypothetical protein Peur_041233 [Populus x canadensis]